MRKMIPLLILFGGVLAGCTAQMMETRGDKMAIFRSPTEKPGRGGIIRYNNRGKQSWRQARRKDAEKQMEQFCQGAYAITTEGPRSRVNLQQGIGFDALDPNQYIAFDCAKAPEPTLFR
jgi:hypothetical protein